MTGAVAPGLREARVEGSGSAMWSLGAPDSVGAAGLGKGAGSGGRLKPQPPQCPESQARKATRSASEVAESHAWGKADLPRQAPWSAMDLQRPVLDAHEKQGVTPVIACRAIVSVEFNTLATGRGD